MRAPLRAALLVVRSFDDNDVVREASDTVRVVCPDPELSDPFIEVIRVRS